MIAFSIGFIHIYRYGIFYALSFLCGYIRLYYVGRYVLSSQKAANLKHLLSQHLDDVILAIMGGVLIGGRLGHVLIYNTSYYLTHPWEAFAFREGGMSFIGGFVGVAIALSMIIRIHKLNLRDLLMLTDMIMVVLPVGIGLGRFGNFLNQELVGLPLSALYDQGRYTLAASLHSRGLTYIYPRVDELERINTNFISMFLEGLYMWIVVIIAFICSYRRQVYRPGLLTGTFMVGYCIIRFGLEYLRQDSNLEFIGMLTISQYYFIVGTIIGITILLGSMYHKSHVS